MKLCDVIPELERILVERKRIAKLREDTHAEIKLLESTTSIDDTDAMAILSALRTKYDLCPIVELRLREQLKKILADAGQAVRRVDAELRLRAVALRTSERAAISKNLTPFVHGRHHSGTVAAAANSLFDLGRGEHTALDIENTLVDVRYTFSQNPSAAIGSLLRLVARVNADFPE